MSAEPRDDRVDARHRAQVLVGQLGIRVRRKGRGEGLEALRLDREAGCGAVAAEAAQVRGAGRERAVQVERRHRAAGALPVALRPRDQHDGSVEALDEPRRDDPDHALVPVLAPEHVAAPAAPRLGPRLDLGDAPPGGSGSRPPAGRGSAPRARPRACSASFASSVSSSSSAASGRPSRPAALIRGARRKPTAPASTAAGSTRAFRISAWRPGRCVRASARSPAIASERFSSSSGTTSAIVASATRSR